MPAAIERREVIRRWGKGSRGELMYYGFSANPDLRSPNL